MKNQEIHEIRAKHHYIEFVELRPNGPKYCAYCWQDNEVLYEAERVEYPCDVIQVLDAWDAHEEAVLASLQSAYESSLGRTPWVELLKDQR